ncbi:unnamed protein product [Orchesella dallaii]|uniref:Uncharacterized protein n=1 Tax=Orchesella dallaii TaxID=48710 RepID=A0ABP1QYF6_9HEXA
MASKMLGRGIRMFRESLLEGAKVAHMFKEDLDEGVTSIMRQNRGVKVDSQPQEESSGLGSFFDSQMLREGVIGGILRFMGINSKQMGVIALNVLIIVAEWITSSMVGNNDMAGATSRMIKTNLLEWASTGHSPQLEKFLTSAKSHTLPEKLIDSLSDTTGNSTSCVQLLICKMTPVIHGFQDTVTEELKLPGLNKGPGLRTASKPITNSTLNEDASEPRGFLAISQFVIDKFLGRLPPKDRMLDFGDRCEKKFPQCQLLTFSTTH